MKIVEARPDGVRLLEPARYDDERGWFREVWNEDLYRAAGLSIHLAQDNVSFSHRGVLRGMHYQSPHEQAKLISVLYGVVYDVVVDVRLGSPTFGSWYGHELSAENRLQLYAPEGFAHGFLVLSDGALVHYNCSVVYDMTCERAIAWHDPDIGVVWPEQPRVISAKDTAAPLLRDVPLHHLPSQLISTP